MTQTEYMKQIENALLSQRRQGMSSAEEASRVIDDLGMRHLLVSKSSKQTSGKVAVLRANPRGKVVAKKASSKKQAAARKKITK